MNEKLSATYELLYRFLQCVHKFTIKAVGNPYLPVLI